MNEKFTVNDFVSPLESIERVLEMIEVFYLHERFEDMDDAFELIERYKKAVSILKEGGVDGSSVRIRTNYN